MRHLELGLFFAALLCWAPTSAFFPDLSGLPSNITTLQLGAANITEVPAGAFARFTVLQFLCVCAV
jgi:hypothetical protein